jgi:peptidoglycan/xylan/chitin deacetylase (PgdA/CDA1 family)
VSTWTEIGRRARPWAVLLALAALVALVGGGRSGSAAANHPPQVPVVQPPAPTVQSAAQRRQAGLDRAVARVLDRSGFVARGGGRKREVALTFDDGPGPYTPKVLIALNRMNVKATFFVVGRQEATFHTAMLAAVGRGHVIGEHTENHRRLSGLPDVEQYAELITPLQWLSRYGLPRPQLFRPPYGAYDKATLTQLKRLGLLMVLWSVDSQDYERPGTQRIVDRVVDAARPGAIILMHDGGGDRTQTVAAIGHIVRRLRARHYRFVTVPELLRDDPPPATRRLPQKQRSSEG